MFLLLELEVLVLPVSGELMVVIYCAFLIISMVSACAKTWAPEAGRNLHRPMKYSLWAAQMDATHTPWWCMAKISTWLISSYTENTQIQLKYTYMHFFPL